MSGCGGQASSADTDDTSVTYGVHNATGDTITHVYIGGTNRSLSFGSVDQGATDRLGRGDGLDVPSRIEVHWRDGLGRRHHADVRLGETLGPGYEGPVTVTIRGPGSANARRG